MRGLIAIIVGAALLIGAGYWLRSSNIDSQTAETTVDQAQPAPAITNDTLANDRADVAETAAIPDAASGDKRVSVFRPGTPPELLADIAAFQRMRDPQADAARARIVARGPGQMPAVMAALDDVVTNGGTLAQQNHLMAVAAQLGDPSHADELIAIAAKISPDNLMSGSIYDVLDIIGAPQKADRFALDIIADTASDSMRLTNALARFWYVTPDATARQALQHRDNSNLQIRGLVYRLAVNGGLDASVVNDLKSEVSGMQFGVPGNITTLNVLATLEAPEEFSNRIEGIRLRPDVKRAAVLMNEFSWASDAEKYKLLPRLLASDMGEVLSTATAYILQQGRVDTLSEYGLAVIEPDPFAAIKQAHPNFESMSRQQKLSVLSENELADLEQVAANRSLIITPRTQKVAGRLGYSIVAVGETIQIRSLNQ